MGVKGFLNIFVCENRIRDAQLWFIFIEMFEDGTGWQLVYLVKRLDWLEKLRMGPML